MDDWYMNNLSKIYVCAGFHSYFVWKSVFIQIYRALYADACMLMLIQLGINMVAVK